MGGSTYKKLRKHTVAVDLFKRQTIKAFTLLEVLIVLVILGLLAGYVAPKYFAQLGKSEVKVAMTQMKGIEQALDAYRLDTGRYPTTEQGLAALMIAPQNETRWQGPYLKSDAVPKDPWNHSYLYLSPAEGAEFEIKSLGKDGSPGGSGENADIVVR